MSKNKKKDKKNKWHIVILLISVIIALIIYHGPNGKPKKDEKVDFSGVNKICELATLKCYYHNVAKLNKDSSGVFQYGWGKYGYKKYWMEYDAVADIVVDTSEITINPPDEKGFVKIYVPPVKVKNLSPVNKSMEKPIIETGAFTEITLDEKTKALEDAQEDMKISLNKDIYIKNQAHENAKRLIKEYVENIGRQMGKKYTVKWLNKANNISKGEN